MSDTTINFTCSPPLIRSLIDKSTNVVFNLSEENKMAAVQLMAIPPEVELEVEIRIK